MRLVHRTILRNFLGILGRTLTAALILFTLVDLLDHLGSFLDNGASTLVILRYYVYKGAWIIDTVLPIAMLMATLFSVGTMARYFELNALFAAGWSLMQVTRPLLALALLTSLASFAWREYVLPPANAAMDRVWEVEVHQRTETIRPTRDIAVTGEDGRLYHAKTYNPATHEVTGLRIMTTDGANVVERVDADKARWTGDRWVLLDGVRRVFRQESELVFPFADLVLDELSLTPEALYQDRVKPEDMTVRQLRRHIRLVRLSGSDITEPTVDLHFRLAFPVIHVIVVFMGILLASGPRKTTIAQGFFLTVLVSFGYYLCMNFGKALGHSGALPPLVAGWGGNAIYAGICAVLYARARR